MSKMIALDVGGTFVKYATFVDGKIADGSQGLFPINEKGTSEEILSAILNFLKANPAEAMCVSIPGPMDYPTGTSQMKHKFASLFGIPMKAWFEERLPGTRVDFVHDGVAFLIGVLYLKEGEGAKKPAGVMLGTGLGFGYSENGKVLITEKGTPCGPLWNMPYRDGIAEDYISARAIRAAYLKAAGNALDVKEIADLARKGDEISIKVLHDAGEALGELMQMRKESAGIDRVILGGQIAKAADLFLPAAKEKTDVEFKVTGYLDNAALYGTYAYSVYGQALVELQA